MRCAYCGHNAASFLDAETGDGFCSIECQHDDYKARRRAEMRNR